MIENRIECTIEEYTQLDFRNDIKSFDDIISILGRKWKSIIEDICLFCEYYKHSLSTSYPFGINQNTESNKILFGSQQNLSNLISKMISIDLLKCTNQSYKFIDEFNNDITYCKTYIFNFNVYNLIDILYKQQANNKIISNITNIRITARKSTSYNGLKKLPKNDYKNLQISNHISGLNGWISDADLKAALMQNDEKIRITQTLIDKINDFFISIGHFELIQYWNPHICYRKNTDHITKIGLRCTSHICTLPKEGNTIYNRQNYLKTFFKETPYSFDVNASIYRITKWVNTFEWLSNDVDLYSLIYGEQFETNEERNQFKLVCMKAYFGGSSKEVARNIRNDRKLTLYNTCSEEDIERLRESLRWTIGKECYGSGIFVWESYIYALVTLSLIEMGITPVQIYDCWYTDKQINMEDIINKVLNKLRYDYTK